MSSGLEIAGSCLTFVGGVWLSIDAFLARKHIRSESGASKLLEILKSTGAAELLKDKQGKPLNLDRETQVVIRSIVFK